MVFVFFVFCPIIPLVVPVSAQPIGHTGETESECSSFVLF